MQAARRVERVAGVHGGVALQQLDGPAVLAYQVADDIQDATADAGELGKPTGCDAALGRPSAVLELGLDGAVRRLRPSSNRTPPTPASASPDHRRITAACGNRIAS